MKKHLLRTLYLFGGLMSGTLSLWATPEKVSFNEKDTTDCTSLNEVLVTQVPSNNYRIDDVVKRVTSEGIDKYSIHSTSDLIGVVPNLYIPAYGSKYSSSIGFRGITSRAGNQKIALFVDGVPTMTYTFNRNLYNLSSVDVMSAAESSTLGRNAMGGAIHLKTPSSFVPSRLELKLNAGNYEYTEALLKGSLRLNRNNALSFGGFYNTRTGYFTNLFTGQPADSEENAGGFVKYEWRDLQRGVQPSLTIFSDLDYANQGAFPYAKVDLTTQERGDVNYNDEGSYRRIATNHRIRYSQRVVPNSHWVFRLLSGVSSLQDNLKMDMDYTPNPIFSQTQKQNQWAGSVDLLLEDLTPTRNLRTQWGISLFAERNRIDVPLEIKPMGLAMMVQPGLNVLNANDKIPVTIEVDKTKSRINENEFTKQSRGLFFYTSGKWVMGQADNWILSWGLRSGYDQQLFDYRSGMDMGVFVAPKANPNAKRLIEAPVDHSGSAKQGSWEVLPKLSLQYNYESTIGKKGNFRVTLSRGYKSGGYSEQRMADVTIGLVSEALRAKAMGGAFEAQGSAEASAYKPEHAWHSELAWKGDLFRQVKGSVALFYSHIVDSQIIQFVASGAGRTVVNAGESRSLGAEFQLDCPIYNSLRATLSYGWVDSRFSNYEVEKRIQGKMQSVNLRGKFVPYVPNQTASLLLHFNKAINRGFVKNLYGALDLRAVGKTYWDEMNTLSEPLYATMGAKVGLNLKNFGISLWGRNLTNTAYSSFYFVSMGSHFLQKGAPLTVGVDFTWRIFQEK